MQTRKLLCAKKYCFDWFILRSDQTQGEWRQLRQRRWLRFCPFPWWQVSSRPGLPPLNWKSGKYKNTRVKCLANRPKNYVKRFVRAPLKFLKWPIHSDMYSSKKPLKSLESLGPFSQSGSHKLKRGKHLDFFMCVKPSPLRKALTNDSCIFRPPLL